MKILGICNDETASASLMINGQIVSAASEERFSRKKLDNSFPLQAIKFCLDHQDLSLDDVDVIAYAWSKGFDSSLLENYVESVSRYSNSDETLNILRERISWEVSQDQKKRAEFDDWVDLNINKKSHVIVDFYHHEAHAASAALVSPFDNGYVFTSDGRGDFESTTIWRFDRFSSNQLEKVYSSFSHESFGFYYGRITGLLGFKPMRHEGKITGLAAYGNSEKTLNLCKKMIEVKDGKVIAYLGDYYKPFFAPYSDVLVNEASGFSKEDIAAGAQFHLEEMMCDLLDYYLEKDNVWNTNLMLAGGVFGNVKVTQRLKELNRVKNVYVQPQMGDGGLCIGACALANEHFKQSKNTNSERYTSALTSMYLGPLAKFRDISSENLSKYNISEFDVVTAVKVFSEALLSGKVIGLINGRMEFGPRALCNRSIIVKTSDKTINDWLNKRMSRTEFMPFAPVMRQEVARYCIEDYSIDDVTLDFMTSTVDCTDHFSNVCPAVVHVDKTARPQIVTEQSNPFIWNVLKIWENLSGELSLINTSFNVHEEPIICDVDEGLVSLDNDVIDQLWVVDDHKGTCFTLKTPT